MIAIDWKEPPAAVLLTATELVAAELKANPGRWARVAKDLKSKRAAPWKKLGLEVVTAPAESDATLWDVYARAPQAPVAKPAPRATSAARKDAPTVVEDPPASQEAIGRCGRCNRKNIKVNEAGQCRLCRVNTLTATSQKVA